jgi:uncharacterized protein (DUF927 family)
LHGFGSAEALARHLRDATGRYYGTAIRGYLERFTKGISADRDGLLRRITELRNDFIDEHVPAGASGQVLSVAGRFALIAAGGEIATSFGITGWPDGEAERAAAVSFKAWLAERGSAGDRETQLGIAQVRAFLEAHGASRFEAPWPGSATEMEGRPLDQRIVNRAGFKRRNAADEWEYLIPPETWRNEVCKGHDAKLVARELAARGWLLPGSDGKTSVSMYVPGHGQMKLYRLTSATLGGGDDAH